MSTSPIRKVEQVHSQQSKVFYRITGISYLQASKTILRHAIHISILLYVYIDYLNILSSKLSITIYIFSNVIFYLKCLYEIPITCNFLMSCEALLNTQLLRAF